MPASVLVILFFIGVFAVVGIVLAAAAKWLDRSSIERDAIAAQLFNRTPSSPLLKTEILSSISLWAWLLSRFAFVERLKTTLSESGVGWSVGRLTSMMLLLGGIALGILTGTPFVPAWAVIMTTGLAMMLPQFYVLRRRRKRLGLIEEQLPDALDFLARSLRAGHPFSVALEMLGNEDRPPLSSEIRKTAEERKLGMSWESAFENLRQRVPLQEMSVFAAAVQLQSRTGGKLNEVLVKIAENMREVSALRGEVRAISAHGRLSGTILTLLPLAIVAAMAMVNPDYLRVLTSHPRGRDLIAAAICCLIAAHFIIRKMVTIRT